MTWVPWTTEPGLPSEAAPACGGVAHPQGPSVSLTLATRLGTEEVRGQASLLQ